MQKIGEITSNNEVLIQTDVSLQAHNSLAVPAKAAYFSRCSSVPQLLGSLDFAKSNGLSVLVLGEGSNIVLSGDYDGMVVLNRLTGIELVSENSESVVVDVAAGENWHDFVGYALERAWFGLENLALIPGLVGAAPIQNIGAYGVEVKDSIEAVHVLDIESGQVRILSNSDCQFAYRDSIFKHALSAKYVITSVVFRLLKTAQLTLTYPALAANLTASACPIDVYNAVCQIRASKLPMPDDIPNAGSFFKNPVVDQDKHRQLTALFPSIVAFPLDGGSAKLAAAWLIEQCGWKDKSVDAVYVHRDQALVIVNPNFKSGNSILKMAAAIQADVKSTYDVVLEIEPRVY